MDETIEEQQSSCDSEDEIKYHASLLPDHYISDDIELPSSPSFSDIHGVVDNDTELPSSPRFINTESDSDVADVDLVADDVLLQLHKNENETLHVDVCVTMMNLLSSVIYELAESANSIDYAVMSDDDDDNFHVDDIVYHDDVSIDGHSPSTLPPVLITDKRYTDPLVDKLNRCIEDGSLSKETFFYQYLDNALDFALNITRAPFEWSKEIKEFGETLYYHGGEKIINLIRGQGFVTMGRGGKKEFNWGNWNLPFPSTRTLRSEKIYETENGIHKALLKAFHDICKGDTVKPLLKNTTVKVVPVVFKADGMAIKPGMQLDVKKGEIVGTTKKIDKKYIRQKKNQDTQELKDTFCTESDVAAITTLDAAVSLPVGVHYTPRKRDGNDMLLSVINDIKCLQTCSSHVDNQIIQNRHRGILSIEDCCASRCDNCISNQELCQDCHLKGHSSWIPSLRACDYCITHDLDCTKLVVVDFSLDSESKNSSAQEEYKNLKDNDPWLYLLAGSPDPVHTCKRMTRHCSNWFLFIEEALINRVQLRALRNDKTINDRLKKILSVAACRGRDRMDVDSMLEISSNSVREVISKCKFITQTIIPEVYRVYDGNKKGVIGSPTAICNGGHGSFFVADVDGSLYRARLHYPVDVIEYEKGFNTPFGMIYNNGLLFLSEKGKKNIRIIDTVGEMIYNPSILAVKNIKSILQSMRVSFLASANKRSLQKTLEDAILTRGGSDYLEKQKYLIGTSFKQPAALYFSKDIMYVSDIEQKCIVSLKVNIDGIFATCSTLNKIEFPYGNVFSITSVYDRIYLASGGKEGGVFGIPCESFKTVAEPPCASINKIFCNSSSVCGEVHSIHVYSSENVTGIAFSDMRNCTIGLYTLDGIFSLISGRKDNKGSSDGVYGLYNQPTSICVIGSSVAACDTATKMVKLISPASAVKAYLGNIDRFLRTFGVTLPGEKKKQLSLEDAKTNIVSVKRFFDENKERVVNIVGHANVQGPEGVNSIQTHKDINLILDIVNHLITNIYSINPTYPINLSSLTTLYVENFFSEMREGNDMPMMLEFAYKFYSCIKERIKASTKTSFCYFTSPKSYYSKEKCTLRVQLVKIKHLKEYIPKDDICELRDWRCEYGQSVRQMTVRNLSTKDKPGTLPMNCYNFEACDPEPIDFSSITGQENCLEPVTVQPHRSNIRFKKGSFATTLGPLGCSVVLFVSPVYERDLTANVQIYESGLSILEYMHCRNATINCKVICKQVEVDIDDDMLYLSEDDYYITVAVASEDGLTPDEMLEMEIEKETTVQGEQPIEGGRSSRKRSHPLNYSLLH